MWLKYLARSHYERVGSEQGFPHWNDVVDLARVSGKTPRSMFYNLMGYPETKMLKEDEVHDIRKLLSMGDKDGVKALLKLNSKGDVDKVLASQKISSDRGNVRPLKSKDSVYENRVRLLAEYFRTNSTLIMKSSAGSMPFCDFVRMNVSRMRTSDLKVFKGSLAFINGIKSLLPKLVYAPNSEDKIVAENFYLNTKLTDAQSKSLVRDAIDQMLVKNLDVPKQVFDMLTNNALEYQLLPNGDYLRLVDYSHALGTTIADMIELCGMSFVDRVKLWSEYGASMYLTSTGAIRVYGLESKSEQDYVILTQNQVNELKSEDVLGKIRYDAKAEWVKTSEGAISLKELFFGGPKDYSGAIKK